MRLNQQACIFACRFQRKAIIHIPELGTGFAVGTRQAGQGAFKTMQAGMRPPAFLHLHCRLLALHLVCRANTKRNRICLRIQPNGIQGALEMAVG